jgi:hypothetical protein
LKDENRLRWTCTLEREAEERRKKREGRREIKDERRKMQEG